MYKLRTVAGFCVFFGFGAGLAEAEDGSVAARTILVVEKAIQSFETNCGLSIIQDRLPGEVQCGLGVETIGTAWGRLLVEAGLPKSFDDREKITRDLDLDPSASLVLVGGMARKEGINYLLAALAKAKAAGR